MIKHRIHILRGASPERLGYTISINAYRSSLPSLYNMFTRLDRISDHHLDMPYREMH